MYNHRSESSAYAYAQEQADLTGEVHYLYNLRGNRCDPNEYLVQTSEWRTNFTPVAVYPRQYLSTEIAERRDLTTAEYRCALRAGLLNPDEWRQIGFSSPGLYRQWTPEEIAASRARIAEGRALIAKCREEA